jgi:hypothetical protein
MRGGSHGSNVCHGDDAGTPRMMKKPFPGLPKVEVVMTSQPIKRMVSHNQDHYVVPLLK